MANRRCLFLMIQYKADNWRHRRCGLNIVQQLSCVPACPSCSFFRGLAWYLSKPKRCGVKCDTYVSRGEPNQCCGSGQVGSASFCRIRIGIRGACQFGSEAKSISFLTKCKAILYFFPENFEILSKILKIMTPPLKLNCRTTPWNP